MNEAKLARSLGELQTAFIKVICIHSIEIQTLSIPVRSQNKLLLFLTLIFFEKTMKQSAAFPWSDPSA